MTVRLGTATGRSAMVVVVALLAACGATPVPPSGTTAPTSASTASVTPAGTATASPPGGSPTPTSSPAMSPTANPTLAATPMPAPTPTSTPTVLLAEPVGREWTNASVEPPGVARFETGTAWRGGFAALGHVFTFNANVDRGAPVVLLSDQGTTWHVVANPFGKHAGRTVRQLSITTYAGKLLVVGSAVAELREPRSVARRCLW